MNTKKTARYTKTDFEKEFPNNDACLEWLKNYRFPQGIHCVVCDKITKHHKIANRPCYKCDNCGHEIYPLANTIFHKSATPLKTWLEAMYWMSTTRSGRSAKELQRITGVTYKTAWRMFKQIRSLMGEDTHHLTGEVEVDETYVGGAQQGKRGRGAEGKSIVIGAVQRQGKVIAKVVEDVKAHTIVPFTVNKVDRDATLYTDTFPSYDHIARFGIKHLRINHHDKEYVRGNVHTNNIEGFWSLVKRGIGGVYHAVSPKYLQSYVNEYSFRYNHRNDETPMFQVMLNRIR
jgi:transposase-like protein